MRHSVAIVTASLLIGLTLPGCSQLWAKDEPKKPKAEAKAKAKQAKDGHGKDPHWSYGGKDGPDVWGDLGASFATCEVGKAQSPINISGAIRAELPRLNFAYRTSAARVANNGHTIQVNLEQGGLFGTQSGIYSLAQFHFHTPSEEQVGGKSFPLVAHLVHKNEAGGLAVVAVLFEEGEANPELERIFAAMPSRGGEDKALESDLDVATLLPGDLNYYAFDGSLTTPPCSEGVKWHVLKQPMTLSPQQLARFRALYPMNARPVQPVNGRYVLDSGAVENYAESESDSEMDAEAALATTAEAGDESNEKGG